jgi:hypothetical protein
MSILELRVKVDHQYEHWIRVSKRVLEDGKVNCDEARQWLTWYKDRRPELDLLKKETQLEVREIRNGYRVKIAGATVRGQKTRLREAQDVDIAPYEELLEKLDRLLIEGAKLKPTLETFLKKECS